MTKTPNRKRGKQIVVRLSDEEYDRFIEKVEKSNLSQNEYFIKCVTGKKIIVIEGLKEVLTELKRIGANINQISKNLNSGIFQGATEDIRQIRAELSKTTEAIITVLKGVR